MPPKKGSGKRKARPSEVSSVAASPPPKKPRVLGRARSDSIPHLSLEASTEDPQVKTEQLFGSDSEKTEIEDTKDIPPTGPWEADPENFENHILQRGPINLGLVTAYPPHNEVQAVEVQAVDIEVKLTTQSNHSESESVKALTYKSFTTLAQT
ncbi:hypothetical protein MYU51_015159 [Penicillium brevicompactum]